MKSKLPKPILTTVWLQSLASAQVKTARAYNLPDLQRQVVSRVLNDSEDPGAVARDLRISVDLLIACIVAHYNDEAERRAEAFERLLDEQVEGARA